jgi:hypothetical protein
MGKEMMDLPNLLVNEILSRTQLARQLMDGSRRNLDQECGYPTNLTADLFHSYYGREGIATRVVNCMPEECWTTPPSVYETEEADETEFEAAWKELDDKLHLFYHLHRIDELSGVGRFGVLLLGYDDGEPLSAPIDGIDEKGQKTGKSAHQLLYLRPFDESVVTIKKMQNDTSNPRYGQPVLYSVEFQSSDSTSTTQDVHWSRIVHIADRRQMSEVFGTPRMKPVFNRLFDLRKILGSSGETFWKGALPGYAFEIDPELAAQGVELDKESLRSELANYVDGLQRYMALKGVKITPLSPQVVDPTPFIEVQLKAIAVSLSIPFRILFGSEQAQLASSQDAENWGKRVKRRQQEYLTPMVVRPFVDRLIVTGVLPEPKEYTVEWSEYLAPTEADAAALALTRTDALSKYVAGGVDQIIPPREYMIQILGFEPEQVDAIMEAAEERIEEEEMVAPAPKEEVGEETMPPFESTLPVAHYDPNQPRDEAGRFSSGGGGGSKDRRERALRSHKPSTKEKQRIAEMNEKKVAKAIGGQHLEDNEPFDVLVGTSGVEVKTIIAGKNNKITMHPSSRRRKLTEAKSKGLTAHTVVMKGNKVFYKQGVGSFRLNSMIEVSLSDLGEMIQ